MVNNEIFIKKIGDLVDENKISEAAQALKELNANDVAVILSEIDEKKLPLLFRILPKELAADTFVSLDKPLQKTLIASFGDAELKAILDKLFLDDTVDIIEEMPAGVVKRILKNTPPDRRKTINELLAYPDDSAGSIMTVEYVDLKRNVTAKSALEKIKRTGINKETIYTLYITDENRRLVGVGSMRDLIFANDDALLDDIMETHVIFVRTFDDKETVAQQFEKYGFLALPVVDGEDRMVGIITVDDALEVIREENDADFQIMAAITPNDDTYFKTSAVSHAKNRVFWLLLLMLSATFTGFILEFYQNKAAGILSSSIIAAIPLLMDTGGNCGAQSSTMIIRGIAVGEITFGDFFKALFKEFRIGFIVSIVLSIANFLRIFITYKWIITDAFANDTAILSFAAVLSITLFITVILAKSLGCALPMLAKKLGADPAIMASPFITTIVDACAIFVYFNMALLILK